MPVYTYRCENCGVQFDRHLKFTDKPLTKCPECGHKALRKLFQPAGIVFKGSGFYVTDNRSSKHAASRTSSGASSTSSDTTATAKTEPEKKPAPAVSEDD
jgi:putative FmdB family regulatory protein